MFLDFEPRLDHIHAMIRVYNSRPRDSVAHYGNRLRHYELIYKHSGASVTRFGAQEIDLKQGTVLLLPRGEVPGEYTVRALEHGEAIDILFDSEADFPKAARWLWLPAGHQIGTLFEKAHATWMLGGAQRQVRGLSDAYRIIAELMGWAERLRRPSAQEAVLSPAMDYLATHCLDADFSCAQLAERAGVSYSHFKRLFTERYGMPPSRYVIDRRMELARGLLLSPEHTVTQVALRLGYENVYYFSRAFRREVGVSPSEYRRGMR